MAGAGENDRAWFPLFLDIAGKPCLVAGGGAVALRKVRLLLSFGAEVKVVAKEFLPEFRLLSAQLCRREIRSGDVPGMTLVVDATGEEEAGLLLQAACRENRVPLNTVDVLSRCDVIFPAVLRRGELVAAVSTGGRSPTAAAWVRDQIDGVLPQRFEEILEQMGELRAVSREKFSQPSQRAAWLKGCFLAAAAVGRPLSLEALQQISEEEL